MQLSCHDHALSALPQEHSTIIHEIWHNLSGRTMELGSTQSLTEWVPWILLGGKGGRCLGLNLTTFMCQLSWNLVAWTLWTCPGLSWDCFTFIFTHWIRGWVDPRGKSPLPILWSWIVQPVAQWVYQLCCPASCFLSYPPVQYHSVVVWLVLFTDKCVKIKHTSNEYLYYVTLEFNVRG
jgi:hypothetical protein